MTTSEIMAELGMHQAAFTDRDFDELEFELRLRAGALGWTGDPLKQPAQSVLACARSVAARNAKQTAIYRGEIEVTEVEGVITMWDLR